MSTGLDEVQSQGCRCCRCCRYERAASRVVSEVAGGRELGCTIIIVTPWILPCGIRANEGNVEIEAVAAYHFLKQPDFNIRELEESRNTDTRSKDNNHLRASPNLLPPIGAFAYDP